MLIVTKLGGKLIRGGLPTPFIKDLKANLQKNRFVIVHGGGIEVTDIASKLGKEQRFVISPKGFKSRYTDKETVKIFTMVMAGKTNKEIVTSLITDGIASIGLSGLDGPLLNASRKKKIIILDERGRRRVIDGGYTGQLKKVNTNLLNTLLKKCYIPVIAPIAISKEFEPLNVDGDRVAAYVSGALKADRLILLTDVEGVILEGKVAPKLTSKDVKKTLQTIGPGMITKMYAALEALEMGVEEVIISSGYVNWPITSAMEHKNGTVIRNE